MSKIFLDTNVILEFFLNREEGKTAAYDTYLSLVMYQTSYILAAKLRINFEKTKEIII